MEQKKPLHVKPFTRDQKRLIKRVLKGALAASDELMTELISKKRAASWGVINKGLYDAEQMIRELSTCEKCGHKVKL
jgi:hypothetical protein